MQPNALTSFQQLDATLSGVPFPGRTVGEAIDFLKATAVQLSVGPPTTSRAIAGQYVQEDMLVITFIFALIIIYLVLAAQYESFRDPLIILIALPTAMFGALIPREPLLATVNIYTQVGLDAYGLISKHDILMVDYANRLQESEGDPPGGHREGGGHSAAVPDRRPPPPWWSAWCRCDRQRSGSRQPLLHGIVIAAGMTIGTIFTRL